MHEDILNFNWNNEILNQKKIDKKKAKSSIIQISIQITKK